MGQYYRAMVVDENNDMKVLSPHDFDNGAKLTEFSWCGNWFVNAVLSLIHNKKVKIAFIGDYAHEPFDESESFYASVMSKESYEKYYEAAWSRDEKFKLRKYRFDKADLELLDLDTIGTYLVNHDTGEYLDIGAYINEVKVFKFGTYWAANPLPLLTACGNGLGGGDFHSYNIGYDYVGTWAFATLEYANLIPIGYKQVHFIFKEEEASGNE